MKSIREELTIDNLFKDYAKKHTIELRDRNDFEVGYQTLSLPCPKCEDGQTGHFFYRLIGEQNWQRVGDDVWTCDKCRSKEALESYQKDSLEQAKRLRIERLIKEYLRIPENLQNAGFKNYEEVNKATSVAKQKAVLYAKEFLDSEIDNYNLLIQGNCGTGKTHLCVAIARTVKEKGFSVGFMTTGKLLSMIKGTYKQGTAKTEEEIINDLKKIDLLILDDLGSEAMGGNGEWRIGMIFEIVESRSGKPTIYTSNLTEEDLVKAVGSRVYSRLYDNTKFIDLFTDDYRKRLRIY